jgi:hypothetical protein
LLVAEEKIYAFALPFVAFGFDYIQRRAIKGKRLSLGELCYGPDLGLTGVTTGLASLPLIQKPDMILVSNILTAAFGCWILTVGMHLGLESSLTSRTKAKVYFAKLVLFGPANFLGGLGLAAVLWLMLPK